MNKKSDEYSSRDLPESALLYAKGLNLLRLERKDRHFLFVFKNQSKAKELSSKYWEKNAQVDAKTFSDSLKYLKDRIFAGQ